MAFERLIESIGRVSDALSGLADNLDRANAAKQTLASPIGARQGGGLVTTGGGSAAGGVISSTGGGGGGGGLSGGLIPPAFGAGGPSRTREELDRVCSRSSVTDPLTGKQIVGWTCSNGFYADPDANEVGARVSGRGSGGETAGGSPFANLFPTITSTGPQGGVDIGGSLGRPVTSGPITNDAAAIVGSIERVVAVVSNLSNKVDGDLGALIRSEDGF